MSMCKACGAKEGQACPRPEPEKCEKGLEPPVARSTYDEMIARSPRLSMAEHYYAVSSDLFAQAARIKEIAEHLARCADTMCEEKER